MTIKNTDSIQTWTDSKVTVTEEYFKTTDGVRLRLIDFIPSDEDDRLPIIIFVAGWISMISAWEEVLRVLTPRFRTLYIETREKKSALIDWKQSPEFSIERMVRDIREILEDRVPADRPFCLAGSSLGSTVILEYLARNLRHPVLTVAIAPNAEFGLPRWFYPVARFLPPGAYGAVRGLVKWYLRTYRVDSVREREQAKKYEASLDEADPRRLKASAMTMKGYSLWSKLEKITDPVIIVAAKTDTLHGVEAMKHMTDRIEGARLEVMESNRETHSERAGRFILEHIEQWVESADRQQGQP